MINDLFAERIKRAVLEKELPENTDIKFLTFSLISMFFGTPIGWTRLDPARVRDLYRNNLDVIINGIRKNK